jgi:hypothetical protein
MSPKTPKRRNALSAAAASLAVLSSKPLAIAKSTSTNDAIHTNS